MAVYLVTLFLAFLASALPAGILSVVWEKISLNMTLEVSGVGILRILIALGAVLACILADSAGGRARRGDLSCAGIGIETLGVIGLSLSRLFWHLCLWSFVLGIGFGISLALLCVQVHSLKGRNILLCFSGMYGGVFAGTFLLSILGEAGLGWRTACQALGLVQILLGSGVFLARRTYMRRKDVQEKIRLWQRERLASRSQKGEQWMKAHSGTEKEVARNFCRKMTFTYLSAVLCAVISFCAALWPQSYRVMVNGSTNTETVGGILVLSLGMTAGCAVSALAGAGRRQSLALSECFLAAVFLAEAYLIHAGGMQDRTLTAFQFLAGAAAGPVFPDLVRIDDVRIDSDAVGSLVSLLPAFYLGAWMTVTPLNQALVGAGQCSRFALGLLLFAAALGLCFFPGSEKEEDQVMPDGRQSGG